jgi:hypothetical protein
MIKKVALHQNHGYVTSVYSVTALTMGEMLIENELMDG